MAKKRESKKPTKTKKPSTVKAKKPEVKEKQETTKEKTPTTTEEVKEEKADNIPEEGGERTIGDIVEEEGLVSEPDRESMIGQEGVPELSEILMRVDRIDGKLELFKDMLDSFSERIVDLNERLGDTRRMVFDREKLSSKLETEFEKVSSIVKELDPEKIILRFEKFKGGIDKQEATISRIDELLINLSGRLKIAEDTVAKIKSLENIMTAAENVNKKLKEIEGTKTYGDKMAAKVEAMFMEVNERVNYLKESVNMIQKHDTVLNDVAKEVETIKFQVDQDLIKKKDADQLIDSVKDIIVEEIVGINPAAFDGLRHRITIIENKDKSSKVLEDEMTKYSVLLDQIDRDFQMGRIKDDTFNEIKRSTEKKIDEIKYVVELRSLKKEKPTKEKKEPTPEKLKEKLLQTVKNEQKAT